MGDEKKVFDALHEATGKPISLESLKNHKLLPEKMLMHPDDWMQFLKDEVSRQCALPADFFGPVSTSTKSMEGTVKYSFCESVTATSYSPWHIRPLTKEGKKLGGGIDTPSLCGRVRKGRGWDLETDINSFHLTNGCCSECLKMFEELGDRPPPGKQKQSW